MLHRRFAAFATLLLLSACGGTGGNPMGGVSLAPPPSIAIAPPTAQVASGGAPITFNATLTGATASVTWALTGPGSVSSTSGATITYTPPATLSEDGQATLLATAGGASAQATIALTRASGIRVAGQVVDSRGHPGADITVSIGTQTTVTDASGHFSLENVTTPYVLAAFSVARNMAVVYQGLTRADPTILWHQALAGPDRRGGVEGGVTGGVSTSTAATFVAWGSPEASTQGTSFTSPYSLQLGWTGPASTTGSVHVLQVSADQLGLPTGFPGYGVRSGVTVDDATTTSAIDVTLAPPTSSVVTGAYQLPQDYVIDVKNVAVEFADGAFFPLGFDDSSGAEFTYVVPGDIGATVDVLAEISGPGAFVIGRKTGIPPGATDVTFPLPKGAPSLAPADGATDVDTQTDFSWESFPGGVYVVTLATPPPGPTYFVVTRDTHASIPQLAALPVPGDTHYDWDVKALAPFESVDGAAGPSLVTPAGDITLQSFGDSRGFVTRKN
jgi:hypothetical protein